MNQGKFVIVLMVAVGLGMAFFAWWARYSASQRVLDRFGADVAVAVRNGDSVVLLGISPASTANHPTGEQPNVSPSEETPSQPAAQQPVDRFSIPSKLGENETILYVTSRQDITRAAGLIHARHHLLHEKGFDWNPVPVEKSAGENWTTGLQFTHGDKTATWIFDFEAQKAYIVERDAEVGIAPIASALQEFLQPFSKGDEPPTRSSVQRMQVLFCLSEPAPHSAHFTNQ